MVFFGSNLPATNVFDQTKMTEKRLMTGNQFCTQEEFNRCEHLRQEWYLRTGCISLTGALSESQLFQLWLRQRTNA